MNDTFGTESSAPTLEFVPPRWGLELLFVREPRAALAGLACSWAFGPPAKLSTRRRGKLLVLDVGARITSANQKWMEVPGDEDDGMELVAALVKARADFRRGCLRLMRLAFRAARSARVFTNAATVLACNSRPAIAA
jgi:hypothetical protein